MNEAIRTAWTELTLEELAKIPGNDYLRRNYHEAAARSYVYHRAEVAMITTSEVVIWKSVYELVYRIFHGTAMVEGDGLYRYSACPSRHLKFANPSDFEVYRKLYLDRDHYVKNGDCEERVTQLPSKEEMLKAALLQLQEYSSNELVVAGDITFHIDSALEVLK